LRPVVNIVQQQSSLHSSKPSRHFSRIVVDNISGCQHSWQLGTRRSLQLIRSLMAQPTKALSTRSHSRAPALMLVENGTSLARRVVTRQSARQATTSLGEEESSPMPDSVPSKNSDKRRKAVAPKKINSLSSPATKKVKVEKIPTSVTPSPKSSKRSTKGVRVVASKKSPARKRKSPSKSSKLEPGSKSPPNGWQDIYSLVEELRQDRTAPVDSDGSEALPETTKGDKTYRFQVLIALMLSSQTKDAVVGDTMQEHVVRRI
jgi:hypothetical protein